MYHKIEQTTNMFTWYIIENMCLSNSELFCVDIPSCKHKDATCWMQHLGSRALGSILVCLKKWRAIDQL